MSQFVVVTPQLMYKTALGLHSGSLLLTKAKKCQEPHLVSQLNLYQQDVRQFKNIRNVSGLAASLAAVAGVVKGTEIGGTNVQSLVSHLPLGWWSVGAVFIGGIILGNCAQSDIKASLKKEKATQKCEFLSILVKALL
jgi:hypothetical protein